MPVYIVLLGAPGAGKGTQAKILSDRIGLAHISSGDIFRENFKNETKLGKLANRYIKQGELVPDDVTIEMIRERIAREDCEPGAILDGFPRTPAQAEALDEMLIEFGGKINLVLFIEVPEQLLIERLTGRWTCSANNHVFHEKFNPPNIKGICDFDRSLLYQRKDDMPITVRNRINVYMDSTLPLINYYQEKGILKKIDGRQSIEIVTEEIVSFVQRVA